MSKEELQKYMSVLAEMVENSIALGRIKPGREIAMVKTKLDEAMMWMEKVPTK